jgi:hypothetical protein
MIVVGVTETLEALAEFPETIEGYCRAVTLIGYLINHEEGIYYLDAPERFARELANR